MAAPDTDETCHLAGHRQAEASSLTSTVQPGVTEPMEEPAHHSYDEEDEADQHQHACSPHPGGNPAGGTTQSGASDADTLGPVSAPHPARKGDSPTHTSRQFSNGVEGARAEQVKAAKIHRYQKRGEWKKWMKSAKLRRKRWRNWIKSLHRTEQEASKEATFTALAHAFDFDDKVRDLFLKGPMENLQDFRYYFAESMEIETFVAETLEPEILNSSQ